ncbi:kinase-like protein [Dendrothele bispora CBS 962.96]|uniref:Kinase-like protein n=1 Tax=Dendrothele bispora (strain CBS 962.96) TaxID=1314807 RepID=A0A4S8LX57_DENBC|nr:kinase-like protein [Dendrothele bispora CBS 962.96]
MPTQPKFPGDLTDREVFWRDRSSWLLERGYQLRPRYQPDWQPSWIAKNDPHRYQYEDAQVVDEAYHLMDGLRVSDGLMVMIKKVVVSDPNNPPQELSINQLLCSGSIPVDDPRNHCTPVYEVLRIPESHIYLVVMPFLRDWWPQMSDVPFSTIGEALGFIRQLFEGVQFLHNHHIAHNDIKHDNILVDSAPLYRRLMHPVVPRRKYDWTGRASPGSLTRHPVKYYFIDFDLTRQYDPQAGPARHRPHYGGDGTVPEFHAHPDEPCDPFAVDVYRLGNLIRRFLMSTQLVWEIEEVDDYRVNYALDFMSPLVSEMTHNDPERRPSMDQVVERFDGIVKGLSFFKLRLRFWPGYRKESFLTRIFWIIPRHFFSQVFNVLGRYPAIPPTPPLPRGKKRR